VAAYRGILKREPESKSVIRLQAGRHDSIESLISELLDSAEYSAIKPKELSSSFSSACEIEVTATARQLESLLRRTAQQWTDLGEGEPYWSVLSHDDYRKSQFEKHSAEFWKSGEWITDQIDNISDRFSIPSHFRSVMELGCGVGRMTRYLAKRFDTVHALDISPGNLAICMEATQNSAGRVHPVLVESLETVIATPMVDAFVSFITLQHNPPPIQAALLKGAFSRLNSGGLAFFQVPTGGLGYSFDTAQFLEEDSSEMDMHCMPIAEVFRCMASSNVECVDMSEDTWSGPDWASHTFVGYKK
jgi:SAM-dependent methyltransferase